ncbi:MAG: hypothetical protein J5755_04085, partial [Clostridia bacterium]|nr:hypothetical protein [Clostridia bacterium]
SGDTVTLSVTNAGSAAVRTYKAQYAGGTFSNYTSASSFAYENSTQGVWGIVVCANGVNADARHMKLSISNANYEIEYETGSAADCYYKISKRPLTAAWTDYFASGSAYTYNGGAMGKTLTVSGVLASDNLTVTNTVTAKTASDGTDLPSGHGFSPSTTLTYTAPNKAVQSYSGVWAGYYAVTVALSGDSASNYSFASNPTNNWTIAKRTLKVKLTSTSTTYDRQEHSIKLTVSGLQGSEKAKLTVAYTGSTFTTKPVTSNTTELTNTDYTFKATNAGTYTVTVSALNAITGGQARKENYSFVKDPTTGIGTLTIAQKEVGLTWGHDNTGTWSGYEVTYDATEHTISCTATGVISGDTVNVTLSGHTATNVSNNTATATGLTGTGSANYKLPSGTTQAWKVIKRTVTASWANYQAATDWIYNADYQGKTLSVSNIPSAGSVKFTVSFGANTSTQTPTSTTLTLDSSSNSQIYKGTDAHAYSVTITLHSDSQGNYTLAGTTTASWTIAKRTLSAAWTNAGHDGTYNASAQGYTLAVTTIPSGGSITLDVTYVNKTNLTVPAAPGATLTLTNTSSSQTYQA